MADHAFNHLPTIKWEDGKFFYSYVDGRSESLVPTVRPHGWISESSENRLVSLVKRKGYTFDGSPQFWTGGIGLSMHLIAADGGKEYELVGGDTLGALMASLKRLPDCSRSEGKA
jgi:hypothetical protein